MPSFILTHLLVIEHKNNITTVNIHLIEANVNLFFTLSSIFFSGFWSLPWIAVHDFPEKEFFVVLIKPEPARHGTPNTNQV